MRLRVLNTTLIYGILLLWGFLAFYPLLWMFSASLKTPNEVMQSYSLLPKIWHWETYIDVWNRMNFFKYFFNSVNISLWSLLGINLVFAMASFAIAKLKFPGSNTLFLFLVSMMFVPGITMLIPVYLTLNYLHLLDTHLGLILAYMNGAGPFAIFLFRNYFRSIPHELFESAKMEGAGFFRILLQIYLPLTVPAIATISIMNFIGTWNSLILPLVLLNNQTLFTLPIAIMNLDSSVFRQWNVLMAASLITILPLVIGFFTLQKYFIQGLSAGAVKS